MNPSPEPPAGIMTEADIPLVGEEPTADEVEQIEWAEEAIRNAPALLRDNLRQFVTLDTALLAGSAAFLSQLAMPKWVKVLGATCLLLSLFAALWGSLPRELQVSPHVPAAIRRAREHSLAARLFWLKWASALLFAGLAAFVAGLLA